MESRLTYIDITRGICIILVVIGHTVPPGSPEWYVAVHDIIYCFHMPLFMYVSGFVHRYFQKPIPYRLFIAKKFKRLMMPYFLVSILIICIKLVVERGLYLENPVGLSAFYKMLYLPSAGVFLWFVYVLFMIFLIIPYFNTNRKINILLVMSFILLLLPAEFTNLYFILQFKAHLFYFALGCFTCQYSSKLKEQTVLPIWIKILVFGILYMYIATDSITLPLFSAQIVKAILAITGIAVILDISRRIDSKMATLKSIFIRLAVYSYTIYLFHTIFQGFAKAIFTKFPLENYIGPAFTFFLILIAGIMVGIIGPIALYEIDFRRRMITRKN
jgi:fucose 4-O-acetylase-like acetyltransferase